MKKVFVLGIFLCAVSSVVAEDTGIGQTVLSPAISATLEGGFSSFSGDLHDNPLSGYEEGHSEGVVEEEGFYLGHNELILSSNIDDLFFGQATIAAHEEEGSLEVAMEEAFIQSLGLPAGLSFKAGRILPIIGYLNERHLHTDYFVQRPLSSRVFLSGVYVDDGVQLSVVLPTEYYLEVGAGIFSGRTLPATKDDGIGALSSYVRTGGDIGDESSWRLGVSYLRTQAKERVYEAHNHGEDIHLDSAGNDHYLDSPEEHLEHEPGVDVHHEHLEELNFTGDSNTVVAEAKWEWAPNGNPREEKLEFRGEFFVRYEDGTFADDSLVVPADITQSGWYLQAVYKFLPQWSAGYRRDQLHPESSLVEELHETALDSESFDPGADTFQLQYSRSEFSKIRASYTLQRFKRGEEHQFLFNYVVSLGAHGAHSY